MQCVEVKEGKRERIYICCRRMIPKVGSCRLDLSNSGGDDDVHYHYKKENSRLHACLARY